jgi:GT2 family glycosyltransferase
MTAPAMRAPSTNAPARVLIGVLVYGGRDFVPRCIESAARVSAGSDAVVDTLVLDDCSPDEEFGAALAAQCERLGVGYYRSPRNVGIPRNMNLALLESMASRYDYVVVANSDVVFPVNLADQLVATARTDATIGSITPWSNDVSIYRLLNDDPERNLSDPATVDWVSSTFAAEFDTATFPIPTGVGYCLFIPTPVVRDVGLFDPVFGRGYCEEVDWCLRSHARGYRSVLAPGTFVYHMGSASTREAGVLQEAATTVWEHEHIVDLRYPRYRAEIDEFFASGVMGATRVRGSRRLMVQAARELGWSLELSSLPRPGEEFESVRVVVGPDGDAPHAVAHWRGYSAVLATSDRATVLAALEALTGRPPDVVRVLETGTVTRAVLREAQTHAGRIEIVRSAPYPERV